MMICFGLTRSFSVHPRGRPANRTTEAVPRHNGVALGKRRAGQQGLLIVLQFWHRTRWPGDYDRQPQYDLLPLGRDHCRARLRRPDSVQSWESLRRVIHEQQRRPQTGRDGTGGSALPRQACSRIGCAVCRWTQRLASVKSGVAMESIEKRAH
jgi:hypothetical protein